VQEVPQTRGVAVQMTAGKYLEEAGRTALEGALAVLRARPSLGLYLCRLLPVDSACHQTPAYLGKCRLVPAPITCLSLSRRAGKFS